MDERLNEYAQGTHELGRRGANSNTRAVISGQYACAYRDERSRVRYLQQHEADSRDEATHVAYIDSGDARPLQCARLHIF